MVEDDDKADEKAEGVVKEVTKVLLDFGVCNWRIFTLTALIRLYPSVCHNVFSQITSQSGWVIALHTLVWLLPWMSEQVCFQMWSLTEWFAALFTIVRLIQRMSEQMPFKNCILIKWFAAFCTLEQFLSSVNHHVASELTSPRKWFVALCTLVWLLSNVNLHVGFKMTCPFKCFAALCTLVCFLFIMRELVIIQTFSLVKCFLALTTFVKVLPTPITPWWPPWPSPQPPRQPCHPPPSNFWLGLKMQMIAFGKYTTCMGLKGSTDNLMLMDSSGRSPFWGPVGPLSTGPKSLFWARQLKKGERERSPPWEQSASLPWAWDRWDWVECQNIQGCTVDM